MAIGFSIGGKKIKTDQQKKSTQQQTGTQDTQGTQFQSQVNETVNRGQESSSSVSDRSGFQAGTTVAATTGRQDTESTTRTFSSDILAGLEGIVGQLFGQAAGGRVDTSRLDFDRDAFVEGGVAAADARGRLDLEDSLNGLVQSIGGNAGSNSAVALLSNRINNDYNANLAGIRSGLEGQAADIIRGNINTEIAAAGQEQQFLGNLLSQLRGGVTTTSGTAATTGQESSSAEQINNDRVNNQANTISLQQQLQTQQLISLLSQLVNTNTTTKSDESLTGTTSEKGSGFGLSL